MIASGNGIDIKSLNQKVLSNIDIPIQESLKVQTDLIDKIETASCVIHSLIEIYNKKIIELTQLKSSILNHEFSSEITKAAA